jgi:hypothetical protein
MASGEPLAGVKQTLKEKRTSETTALDFVPSWVGQHSTGVDTESFTPHGAARSFSITHQGGK